MNPIGIVVYVMNLVLVAARRAVHWEHVDRYAPSYLGMIVLIGQR
jgi:hypothetical protein